MRGRSCCEMRTHHWLALLRHCCDSSRLPAAPGLQHYLGILVPQDHRGHSCATAELHRAYGVRFTLVMKSRKKGRAHRTTTIPCMTSCQNQ